MLAILEKGGKQYMVREGDEIEVEKIEAENGSQIELNRVLLISDENVHKAGNPYVEGAKVIGRVVGQEKGKKIIVFEIDGSEIKLGEGQASKILVEYENETIQVNSLKEGESGKISKIFSGTKFTEKLKGAMQGKTITLVKRETSAPVPIRGNYVVAKIGKQLITIGKGLAEKIQVTYF